MWYLYRNNKEKRLDVNGQNIIVRYHSLKILKLRDCPLCRTFAWFGYKISSLELRVVLDIDVSLESIFSNPFRIALKHLLEWHISAFAYFSFWLSFRRTLNFRIPYVLQNGSITRKEKRILDDCCCVINKCWLFFFFFAWLPYFCRNLKFSLFVRSLTFNWNTSSILICLCLSICP